MRRIGLMAAALAIGVAGRANAQSVGTINVCYYTPECGFAAAALPADMRVKPKGDRDHVKHGRAESNPVVDAPAFQFVNNGATPIKGAVFKILANKKLSIPADSYDIGTIPANSSVTLLVGASNDGKTRPDSSYFFWYFGANSPRDTSDVGPDDDAITFEFTGKVGKTKVSSGTILTSATAGAANDGSVAHINFLGGPGNADGPCNDCVGPYVIGQINPVGDVPH
jgi:hypothetical protein